MNIVYSLTCHEDPESFMDFLRNIIYFNKDLKIAIVIHGNDFMFKQLNLKLQHSCIHLNTKTLNRKLYTIDIFRSHIENFEYCKSLEFKYFIPLASNCYFKEFVTINYIENLILNSPEIVTNGYVKKDWNWPAILRNFLINTDLENEGCKELFAHAHEGILLNKDQISKISEIYYKNNLQNKVQFETVFEEYLFSSIYSMITGKQIQTLCHVFFELPNYTPTLKHIEDTSKLCVKRVERNFNNNVRVHYRQKTNNYEGVKID